MPGFQPAARMAPAPPSGRPAPRRISVSARPPQHALSRQMAWSSAPVVQRKCACGGDSDEEKTH